MDFLHDVVNEEIFLELLLEDEDLMLGLDAVVPVHPPNLKGLRQYAGVQVHQHRIILINRLDLALKSTKVFLNLKHLEILLLELFLLLFLLDEVEEGDC